MNGGPPSSRLRPRSAKLNSVSDPGIRAEQPSTERTRKRKPGEATGEPAPASKKSKKVIPAPQLSTVEEADDEESPEVHREVWQRSWDDLLASVADWPESTKESVQALRNRAEKVFVHDGFFVHAPVGTTALDRRYFEDLRRLVVEGEARRFDEVWQHAATSDENEYQAARMALDAGLDPTWPRVDSVAAGPTAPIAWRPLWQTRRDEVSDVLGFETFDEYLQKDYESLLERAAYLSRNGIYVHPPEWPMAQTPLDYIKQTLQTAVASAEMVHFEKMWHDDIAEKERLNDDSAAEDLRVALQKMKQEAASGEQRPYPPAYNDCLRAWGDICIRDPRAKEASGETMQSFWTQFNGVADIARNYDRYPPPPPWAPELSLAEYIPILRDSIRRQRAKCYQEVWHQAIRPDGEAFPEDPTVQARYEDMRAFVEGGGEPYFPHEAKPAPPPAPPANLDSAGWKAESINLGFGSPEDIAGRWTYRDTLGVGAFGHAGLWVQYNDEAKITARMVIKDTFMNAKCWTHWRFRDMPDGLPYEIKAHLELSALPGSDNIPLFHGHAVHPNLRNFRVYMEHCKHDTLHSIIQQYRNLNANSPVTSTGRRLARHIPTRVVWAYFEALTTALCLEHANGWVHWDFKPSNILAASPSKTTWAEVPTLKVSDFGGCYPITGDNYYVLAQALCNTPGYRAPEAISNDDDYFESDDGEPVYDPLVTTSVKSDIWSLAVTMIGLMNLDLSGPKEDDYAQYYSYDLEDHAVQHYPPRLVQLVQSCHRNYPQDRPSAAELLRDIKAETSQFETIHELPLKLQPRQPGEIILYKPDPYLTWSADVLE